MRVTPLGSRRRKYVERAAGARILLRDFGERFTGDPLIAAAAALARQ
jgi:hypothetical protein